MKRFRTRRTRAGKRVWLLLAMVILGASVALLCTGQAEASTVSKAGVTIRRSSSDQPMLFLLAARSASTPRQSEQSLNGCDAGIGPAQVNVCNQVQGILVLGVLYPLWKASIAIVQQGLPALYATDPKRTYLSPDIELLTGYTQDATDLFLVLIVLFTGLRMVWEQSAFSWANFRETLPSVFIAFLLSRISLNLAGAVISLNNALITLFLPTANTAFSALVPANLNLADLPTTLLESFLGITLMLLVIEAAVRLPVLGVLLVLSPAGCFALAWKPTQQLGFLWFNAFLAAVFVQFLQLLLLALGLVTLKSLYPPQQMTYIGLIGGIALLLATLTIPFAAYRWAIQPVVSTARATVDGTIAAGRTIGMASTGL